MPLALGYGAVALRRDGTRSRHGTAAIATQNNAAGGDVGPGASADEIFAQCQTLIDRIWAHAATTKLYVLSLLPINERLTADKNLIDKSAVVAEVNQKLRHYCQTNHIAYINLFKQFVFHGTYTLQDALTTDGVHLTPMAYKRWAFFLKKFTATAEQS